MKDHEIKKKLLKDLKQNSQIQRIFPLIILLDCKIKGGLPTNAYWNILKRDIDTVTHLTYDEVLKKIILFNNIPRLPEMEIIIQNYKPDSKVASVKYKNELIDIACEVDITKINVKEYLEKQDLLTNTFLYDPENFKLYHRGGALQALEQKQATLIKVSDELLDDRLRADPIKIFKPVKAAVEKGFTIEEKTKEAIIKNACLIEKLPETTRKLIIKKHFNTDYAAEYLKYDASLGLLPYLFADESLLKLIKDEKLQNSIKEELGKTTPKLTPDEIEAIVRKTEKGSESLEERINKCLENYKHFQIDTTLSKQVGKK